MEQQYRIVPEFECFPCGKQNEVIKTKLEMVICYIYPAMRVGDLRVDNTEMDLHSVHSHCHCLHPVHRTMTKVSGEEGALALLHIFKCSISP